MQYKLSNVTRKEINTKFGVKSQIKCSVQGELEGTPINDVTIWDSFANFANLKDGDMVVGELSIKQNGQYTNKTLNMPANATTGAPRGSYKPQPAAIAEAQQNKARNIAEAQDRSAWMWAKTNASTLLAGYFNKLFEKGELKLTNEIIAGEVLDLATKIYNGELVEPFTSKPRIPDMRVDEKDRNITPEDIDAQFNNYPN